MFFICIGANGWAKADTIAAAIARARNYCNGMGEYLVYECSGPADDYQVSPIDGTMMWRTAAPPPVRVRRRWKTGKIDRTRRTIEELRAAERAGA
jgi:hypothetical protein